MATTSLDLPALIRDRAAAYGVDPDALVQAAKIESGLDPNSANPGSSAKGLFQFVDPTWKQYGNGGDPLDPVANADAGARFWAANQKLLSSAGIMPTPGALYLSHFAGGPGALKVLRADPDVPVADLLGSAAVRANPFLAKMSAGDLQDWANRKMAASGSNAPVPQTSGTAVPMAAAAGAPAAPLPLSPAGGGSSDGALPPDLLAQLQAIPQRLAQAQPDISDQAPPPLTPLPDPAAMARARILSRVMAGQPIA